MTTKALSITVAAFALAAASSVFAAGNGEPKLPSSIDPNIPSAEYRVAVVEVDHKLGKDETYKLGQQLNRPNETSLEAAVKTIAGNGKFKLLSNPASVSVVEGQPFPLVRLEDVEVNKPVTAGNGLAAPAHAKVGYILDVDATQIGSAHSMMDTSMRLKHFALTDAGKLESTVVNAQEIMAIGDVHVLLWVLAGKQYAMAIKAERFSTN